MKHFHKKNVVFLLLLVLLGCNRKNNNTSSVNETFVVKKVNLRDQISQTGEVRPIVNVELKSEASGKIEKIYVKEGQKVSRNDTILIIDPSRLLTQKEKLELTIRKSKINLTIAERDYNNGIELVKTGSIPAKKLQDLQMAEELASIEYQQQLLELKDIKDQLSQTVIVSPLSGVITSLLVKEGEIAVSAMSGFQSGTAIGTIADISQLEVVTSIGEVDYVKLSTGQRVTIRPETNDRAGTSGKINFIALSAKKKENEELSGFEVRIAIDSVIAGIAPGVNVTVEFTLLEKDSVLAVPYHFIKKQDSLSFVDIIKKDTKGNEIINNIPVSTGTTDYKFYEILSGLKEGDTVTFKPETDNFK